MGLGRGVGGGHTEMHCLLIITQSSLVPSPDYDCADAQRPDSAHPFPEGELWKPKTVAIHHPPNFSSYAPVSPSLCFSLPLLLSSLQHGSGHASKGSAEQCEGPDRNLTFFFFMVEVCHNQGGPDQVQDLRGENLILSFFSFSDENNLFPGAGEHSLTKFMRTLRGMRTISART